MKQYPLSGFSMKTNYPFRSLAPALWLVCAAMLVLSSSCTNEKAADPVEQSPEDIEDPPQEITLEPAPVAEVTPPEPLMRRLTQEQYFNTMRSLFGPEVILPSALEPDAALSGLRSVGSSQGSISSRGVEQYERAAYQIAEYAMAQPEVRAELMPCQPQATVDDGCARQSVEVLGRLLWRRTLETDEVERLVSLANRAAEVREDFYLGFEYALAAMLQSPRFLFRAEQGEPGEEGQRRFTGYEMAARLSFFLWNTAPDDWLLSAAEGGELTSDEGLDAVVRQMLADPRARQGVRAFFSDMLGLYKLDKMVKDPTIFTQASPEVGPSAREETLTGLEELIFERNGDYRDIFTTRETFINRKLASIYGVPAPAREGFGWTTLPEDGPRVGLLGQVSTLALHSHPVASSATLRGAFVQEVLLCATIPSPPADVDTSIPEPSGDAPTLRDRVKEHLENEFCASCHELTDLIGLGMENFDSMGSWRLRDHGFLIDASGSLDGEPFEGPAQLAEVLSDHPALGRCLVRTAYRYANGRKEVGGDTMQLRALVALFEEKHYRVQALLYAIAMSPGFRLVGQVQE